jgi:hypothetical protein
LKNDENLKSEIELDDSMVFVFLITEKNVKNEHFLDENALSNLTPNPSPSKREGNYIFMC